MGEQCYEVDEKEIAPQDYRERARAVSGNQKFPGHLIFFFSMFGFMCANPFIATAPAHQVYWANIFVGMLLGIFGPGLSFGTGQFIVGSSVDRYLQGIVAGIVSMITNYS